VSKVEYPPSPQKLSPEQPDAPESLEGPSMPRLDELLGVAARFAIACTVPGVIVIVVWNRLSDRLHVSTDLVGFPTWADFNIERYFWRYWLLVVFFPLASLALYLGLTRLLADRSDRPRPPRRLGVEEEPRIVDAQKAIVVSVCRVLFVGAVLGLEAAIAFARTDVPVAVAWIVTAAVYSTLAALVAATLRSRLSNVSLWTSLSAVNALAAPLTIGALYIVSATTEVRIQSTHSAKHYPWFPLWIALPVTIALIVAIARRLRGAPAMVRAVERAVLVFAVAPVLLFLVVASLPGAGGRIDMFHEGEALAAANITAHGAFPWRDLVTIHGLLMDVFPPLIGRGVFEDTRWGWMAASSVIVGPLCWVSLYFLCAYLFRRDWLFLVATQAVIVTGAVDGPMVRFLLVPVVFVLFGIFLAKPTWPRAVGFTGLLIAQVILAPEAALAAVCIGGTLVVFDLYYFRRGTPLRAAFRRTIQCVSVGIVLLGTWLAFLASMGAVGDFFGVFTTFSSQHELTGGLPISFLPPPLPPHYWFAVVTPVVLILFVFWYFVAKIRLRAELSAQDWVIAAATLFAAVYYEKYLARIDHQWESFAVAVPVFLFVAYRLVGLLTSPLNRWVKPTWWITPRHIATLVAGCLALFLIAPNSLFNTIRATPYHFSPSAAQAALGNRLGFATNKAVDPTLFPDLKRLLRRQLGPHDRLFDFTNSPALFYYFLDLPSPTRYYHVSLALHQATQRDLVHELERSRPKLVAFSSFSYGLTPWDGISNQVRNYDVSEYILRHYTPWADSHGFMFMRRIDPSQSALAKSSRRLYFQAFQCDWGYAPNFLTTRPPKTAAKGAPVTFAPAAGAVSVGGWAIDESRKRPAADVVAAVGSRIVAKTTPNNLRPDVAASVHSLRALRSGFALNLTSAFRRPGFDIGALRVYAVFKGNRAAELGYLGGSGWAPTKPPPAVLRFGRHRTVRVIGSPAPGTVEWSKNLTQPMQRLHLPPRARSYDWLEVVARTQFTQGSFTLGDDPVATRRTIRFDSLPGSRKLFVQIGACSQWSGLPLNHILLQATAPQEIASIRLFR
jgi:hypothetical protein